MAQAKYSPFGDSLDPSVAIIQAANALDVAAKFAVESRDSDSLIRIAREWVEMSSRLAYDEDGPEDEEDEPIKIRRFGFSLVSDTGEEEEDGAVSEC